MVSSDLRTPSGDAGGIVLGWLTRLTVVLAVVGGDRLRRHLDRHLAPVARGRRQPGRPQRQRDVAEHPRHPGRAGERAAAATEANADTTVVTDSLSVDADGTAHLVVTREASTIVAQHIGPMRHWCELRVQGVGEEHRVSARPACAGSAARWAAALVSAAAGRGDPAGWRRPRPTPASPSCAAKPLTCAASSTSSPSSRASPSSGTTPRSEALLQATTGEVVASTAVLDSERAVQDSQDVAARRVRAIYLSGGPIGLTGTILHSTSLDDALVRWHAVETIIAHRRRPHRDPSGGRRPAAPGGTGCGPAARPRRGAAAGRRPRGRRRDRDDLAPARPHRPRRRARGRARRPAAPRGRGAGARPGGADGRALLGPGRRAGRQAAAGSRGRRPAARPCPTSRRRTPSPRPRSRPRPRRLGLPYVWGATGPSAFDCSGLTQWAYAQAGVQPAAHVARAVRAAAQGAARPARARRPGVLRHRRQRTRRRSTTSASTSATACRSTPRRPAAWSRSARSATARIIGADPRPSLWRGVTPHRRRAVPTEPEHPTMSNEAVTGRPVPQRRTSRGGRRWTGWDQVAPSGGRYVLRERLEDSALSSSWQAHDDVLDRRVHLRAVSSDHPHADGGARRRPPGRGRRGRATRARARRRRRRRHDVRGQRVAAGPVARPPAARRPAAAVRGAHGGRRGRARAGGGAAPWSAPPAADTRSACTCSTTAR